MFFSNVSVLLLEKQSATKSFFFTSFLTLGEKIVSRGFSKVQAETIAQGSHRCYCWRALFHQKLWILSTSSRTTAHSHFSETDRRICLKVCELRHLFRGTVSLSVWLSGVMMKCAWWETVFWKIKAFSSYTSHGMWLLSKQPSCRERFERFRKTIKFSWTWGRAAKIQV